MRPSEDARVDELRKLAKEQRRRPPPHGALLSAVRRYPTAPDDGLQLVGATEWDAFLANKVDPSPFHSRNFLDAAMRHTKSTLQYALLFSGRQAVMGCPLFLVKRRGISLLSSPPPGASFPYLGPVWDDTTGRKETARLAILQQFADGLSKTARLLRAQVVMLRLGPATPDVRPFLWEGYWSRFRYTYRLDITRPKEELFRSFNTNTRRQIRRAEKSLVVEEGLPRDLPTLFESLDARFHAQGLRTNLSLEYLKDVTSTTGRDTVRILAARRDGELVNAMLVVLGQHTSYAWVGPVKPKEVESGFGSTHLLHWKAIELSSSSGRTHYDLVGAETARLIRYKSGFNPDLIPYFEVFKGYGIGRVAVGVRWRT